MLKQTTTWMRACLIAAVLVFSNLPVLLMAETGEGRASTQSGTPKAASEANLSAALTLSIAKFIEWPQLPTVSEDKPYFIVGVMGTPQTEAAFTQFDGKLIKGKILKTVRVTPTMDLRDLRRCHVIFVDAENDQQVISDMTQRSRGILTVFGHNGGKHSEPCLRLVKEQEKMAFDIDLQCTRRAEFSVDAGLIGLARRVIK